MPKCVFSIDVEDWFHIMELPTAPRLPEWDNLPSLVARNFHAILDTLAKHNVKATCFFLGWVAERHPELVRDALSEGHEVASHGYTHDLIYETTREQFGADVLRARLLLEQIAGRPVIGYRAPGFSVNADTPWFFEELAKAEYKYSSSVFPASRQHGGGAVGFDRTPRPIQTPAGSIVEFPITVADCLGKTMCFFGGGYLRLFPYALIKKMSERVLASGLPVIYYLHPREIDPTHPRLPMSRSRAFKSYIGLRSVSAKVDRLLSDFSFATFSELLCTPPSSSMDTPKTSPLSMATRTGHSTAL